MDATIKTSDGRTVGYATYGIEGGIPVINCHGGPGSRLSISGDHNEAIKNGYFLVGIDRPGYGLSDPKPGRTIADWVTDAIAVADHLKLDKFYVTGVSTGGAYAFALASLVPDRVLGVVACCAMTDMRFEPARMAMDRKTVNSLWNAKNREDAFAPALKMSGPNGEKLLVGLKIGRKLAGMPFKKLVAKLIKLTPADLNYLASFQDSSEIWQSLMLEPYARGVDGFVDDRIADGVGWNSFDVNGVKCPVLIIHGESDTIVNVMNAHHTHELIPQSTLQLSKNEGHLSIISKLMNAVIEISGKKN